MAYLTKEQVAEIVRNAPDKNSVINDLIRAGHQLQGYEEISKSMRPEEPGFVKSIVRGIVNPIARTAYTGYKALAGTVDLAQAGIAAARGDEEEALAQLEQARGRTGKSLNLPYLGEIKALGETGSMGGDIKESVGVGLEIASNIPLARGASSLAKAGFGGLIKEGAKQGAKEGFVGGLLYGAGSGMEEDLTPIEIMTQSAVSAAAGTVFGGAIGGLLGGVGAVASKAKMLSNPVLKKQYIAQQEEKIADIIGDSLNLTKAQRKMQLRSGKDTALFMAREGLPIRVEKGRLVAEEAIDIIQRKATAENAAFESLLLDDGGFIPFSKAKDYAKSLVDDVGQARNLATRHIDNEIAALERQFKKTGFTQDGVTFIPKIVANRLKKKMWEAGKFRLLQTPADQTRAGASRMIGNAFKRLIEETSDDVNIRAFNSRLGDLAEATFMLSERNGSPVKGGKLGKYFARTIGGIVGSPGGTPGSIVGVVTGDKLADLMQDPNIKTWAIRQVLNKLKKEGKESLIDEAESIIARRAIERASRLKLPPPAPLGSTGNPIIARPPTSFEPAAKQIIKNVADETAEALRKQRGAISVVNEGALTTKILSKLEGKKTVSRQFIEDLTNSGDVRQAERDLIRKTLEDFKGGDINVSEFANKVKTELLPLTRVGANGGYENISLPEDLRGPVASYKEHIYQSPIKTSAGQVHFSGTPDAKTQNYFAHTRIEDLPTDAFIKNAKGAKNYEINYEGSAPGNTRRVIEIQSDLFQKGGLEGEKEVVIDSTIRSEVAKRVEDLKQAISASYNLGHDTTKLRVALKNEQARLAKFAPREKEIAKLEPYRNTWHERVIREEVKQAAKDGKTKLQFPTGETALKIEQLGMPGVWSEVRGGQLGDVLNPQNVKKGMEVAQQGQSGKWVVIETLEGGRFKAVQKSQLLQDMKFRFKNIPESDIMEYITKCL